MTTIRIRLVRDRGLLSTAICWWTWGKWSHVEICVPDGYLGARLIGGVQVRAFDYIRPRREEFREIAVTENEVGRFMAFARAQIGKPYDWLAIVGFGLRGRWSVAPHRWFCSELVDASFAAAGVEILHANAAYRLSPRDIGLSPILRIFT